MENRGQHCTLAQLADLEASLPFVLPGVDSDNGGEFINHHAERQQRSDSGRGMLRPLARGCAEQPEARVQTG